MARHFGVERVLIVCPTSLKHQWQSEIARFTRPANRGARHQRPAPAQRRRTIAAGRLLQDHQLRHRPRRSRPDRRLGARPGHPRRGAAHQELEHARGARSVKQIDSALRDRADRHAAGKPAGRTDLHRPVRRPAPAGADLPLLHEHQVKDEAGRSSAIPDLDKIGQTLAPILIRRRKIRGAATNCPSRIDKNLFVPMTEMQMELPRGKRATIVARIVQRGAGPGSCPRRTSGG